MGALIGIIIGAFFGSSIGIVAMGGGVSGLLPLAVVGGVVGFLVQKAYFKKKVSEFDDAPNPGGLAVNESEYNEDSWLQRILTFIFQIAFLIGLAYIIALVFG